MNQIAEEILMHFGVGAMDNPPGRGSGRYPYGSGENPYQHGSFDFLGRYNELKKQGLSEIEIASAFGMSTTRLRDEKRLAKSQEQTLAYNKIVELRDQGYNNSEIARILGYNSESSVRHILSDQSTARREKCQATVDAIKKVVDEKGMVDVGAGVEHELGLQSRQKLDEAITILRNEGYELYKRKMPQATNPGKFTNLQILCKPGTAYKDIYKTENISSFKDYISYDNGDSYHKAFEYPASMDSSRVAICYREDGGADKDGLIEIKRGVQDLSLGDDHYAQVRILVDDTKYMKGMAVYSDGPFPDGCDIIFNTNKSKDTAKQDVLKDIKTKDPNNPFGSLVKENGGQSYYDDPNGNYINPTTGEKQSLSLINKTRDEGDWNEWADKLPSQFLSKQSMKLINKQLGLATEDKVNEYKEICLLNNPTIKRTLLNKYAEECDSAAVHLYAAALPKQKYKVILPVNSLKDTEAYAPTFNNGETVALVRFPHGSTSEIPILTVNNNNKDAKKMIENSSDAICINSNVAARLSGADFDGDAVMIIPCNSNTSNIKIVSTLSKKYDSKTNTGLDGFDPKLRYATTKKEVTNPETGEKEYEYYNQAGQKVKVMTEKYKQTQMGVVSNLITDMTLLGAPEEEICKAIRHSMTVIDAEKHKLDYKTSEIENDIAILRKKWQGHVDPDTGKLKTGSATVISRAKGEVDIPKTQGEPKVNLVGKSYYDPSRPEGALLYKTTDDLYYVNKEGKTVMRTQKSTQMAETDDAMTLVSKYQTQQELAYATYANNMKSLANHARVESANTGRLEYHSSAANTYAEQVGSLQAKLLLAQKNAPRERAAQTITKSKMEAIEAEHTLEKEEKKKLNARLLKEAREEVGAQRYPIDITDKEWEAIQAGAISDTKLTKILQYADIDRLRELATPKTSTTLSTAKVNKMKSLYATGNYSIAEIASIIGCSSATVLKYLN